MVHGERVRPAAALRLHLGPDPPHAGRHPPFDLGYRARLRAGRTRNAYARHFDRLGNAHAHTLGCRLSRDGRSRDERASPHANPHAPGAWTRRGSFRHRAFLASARNVGCRHPADHRPTAYHHGTPRTQPRRGRPDSRLTDRLDHRAAVHHQHRLPHVDRHAGNHSRLRA